ncbi:MAG: hypothetical protein GEV28_25170 [Actinophytocola sp.]|uniref:hypothetical protein n=1 Tax=Actinophytocola sp. TaxID=1872138 RepID=UPI00132B389D|nr:hypothetical protein [Actinophytocola sp.]MPZ83505.1 hypothetical protein [Actinophytocola sp.]
MSELDEDDTQWTDEARESFRTAAANLVEATRQHSAALLEMTGTDADAEAIAEVGEHLEAAATTYADTQFELTGTVPPLGLDEEDDYSYDDGLYYEDEDLTDVDLDGDLDAEGDGEEDVEESDEPAAKLTVLHRVDFVVTDELAVIQAGKEAYHDAWDGEPESDDPDAEDAIDVADLSGALQQIQQAGGIEALADTPGLASAGATTWVLEATDLLDEREPEEWPESPFAPGDNVDQRLLHRLDEVAS